MVDFLTPVEGSIICSLPWPTPEFTHFYLVKSLQFWLLGKPWPEKQSTGCAFALELEECWKGHEVGPAPFVGQKCGQLFEVFKWNLFFRFHHTFIHLQTPQTKRVDPSLRQNEKRIPPKKNTRMKYFFGQSRQGLTWPTMGALPAPFLMGLGYSQGFVFSLAI